MILDAATPAGSVLVHELFGTPMTPFAVSSQALPTSRNIIYCADGPAVARAFLGFLIAAGVNKVDLRAHMGDLGGALARSRAWTCGDRDVIA